MIINDLSMLDQTLNFRLAAGFDGSYRRIDSVSILEHDEVDCGHGIDYGDFVITSWFPDTDDPELLEDTVRILVERDVAGLAVKTEPNLDLDPEILAFADAHRFPVFLFDSIRMSDALLYIHELQTRLNESVFFEEKIHQMFPTPVSKSEILRLVMDINPSFQKNFYCARVIPRTPSADLRGRDFTSIPPQPIGRRIPDFRYSSLVRFENGWLLIASFPDDTRLPDPKVHARTLLYQQHLEPDHLYCGISRIHHDLHRFDVALREASAASRLAVREKRLQLTFEEIGIYQFLLTQTESEVFLESFDSTRNLLEEFDREHRSNLLETLRVYIHNEGRLQETAKDLFVHVNTIRYRLEKARELLHTDDFYVRVYMFIRMYDFLLLNPDDPKDQR